MTRSRDQRMRSSRGVSLPEVLVVVVILAVFLLVVAMLLPAGREKARTLTCRQNLGRIGRGLLLYQNAVGHLPTVPKVGEAGDSPLSAVLGEFGLTSMVPLNDQEPPARVPGPPPSARKLAEFLCPSDPWAGDAGHPAPVSYRACAGDSTLGENGPFGFGRVVRLDEVQAGDGTEYTAAFAERLVGDGREKPAPRNYASVPGPVVEEDLGDPPAGSWRGDAGSDWSRPGWTSTLYNHAPTPNSPRSSIAKDSATAFLGASSSHPDAVHVLMLDGGVRPVRPAIAPAVWRAMATDSSEPAAPPKSEPAP